MEERLKSYLSRKGIDFTGITIFSFHHLKRFFHFCIRFSSSLTVGSKPYGFDFIQEIKAIV